jgi:hypothetical protein
MRPPPETIDLGAALAAAFRARGAEVRIFEEAENCLRRREPGEACTFRGLSGASSARPAALPFVVEVQGIPNLLHELAHVLLLGRVEKDHATEYGRIPFDLTTPDGRRLLFEELACCVASCCWHPGDDAAAQAWFEEQIGIQDVFFGFDGDLARFFAAVAFESSAHRAQLRSTVDRAVAGIEAALAAVGAPGDVARGRRRRSFETLWLDFRRPTSGDP